MAEISVSDLRINNILATSPVRITAAFPTISWTYGLIDRVITDTPPGEVLETYTNEPLAYEIRLGISNTNLGNNSFVGTFINSGTVHSDALSWRYRGPRLRRGTVYYGQIRITDSESNRSDWATFTFRYNALPVVTSPVITPLSPTLQDDLVLSYTFTDADDDVESGTKIWWFKNGVHERQFDGKTIIESKFLSYQDEWMVKIYPSDGYEIGPFITSPAVTIDTATPTATEATITPSSPSYLDPLYAKYSFSSPEDKPDHSVFRWYINGSLVTDVTTAFARLNVVAGDVVHYEVQPNDGDLAGDWVSSESVTIGEPSYRITDLRVDHSAEPLALSSLTPTISWNYIGPTTPPTSASILIGTAPLADNILNTTITDSLGVFTVPDNLLSVGSDYYVSVAMGAGTLGDYVTAHFRTSGSRWAESVSNTTGWTVEATLKVEPQPASSSSSSSSTSSSSSSSSSSSDTTNYQGIRIYDGTKFVELRLFVDKVILVSGTTTTAAADLSDYAVITITGKGSDVNVFLNYELLIDGTGLLTSGTEDKFIEFGAMGSTTTIADYLNLYFTTAGNYDPASSAQYYDLQFSTFFEIDGSIDAVTGGNGQTYFAVSNEEDETSSTVYRLLDYVAPTRLAPRIRNAVNVNSIVVNGQYTYFCHDRGATLFQNFPIPAYDFDLDFTQQDDPLDSGFVVTDSALGASYTNQGLVINTIPDGQVFFSQDRKGNEMVRSGGQRQRLDRRFLPQNTDRCRRPSSSQHHATGRHWRLRQRRQVSGNRLLLRGPNPLRQQRHGSEPRQRRTRPIPPRGPRSESETVRERYATCHHSVRQRGFRRGQRRPGGRM
jgi:hypothetical protein